ncbi:uncharacterized protein N7459_003907 [Penicillium hispanicum]|uniref:uncharacterized protein n=1 Tax=Penicillium hispanicum TaxID=1080232 RepID=UPI002540CDD0|nr:uncharacterized protein N7459_003907 [Penicillium hispanicum]KAJ5584107.1 hypothetical protein N7459_003907 [Penicillium hispanicum]
MSVNATPPSADTTLSQRTSRSSASGLEVLNQRLKHLSDNILPLHPYLLTLPTSAPFRLGSRSANNWAVGHDRPFSSEEQQLQYMTFLTHHDGDSLLVAVGDWSDEMGRMMPDRPMAPSAPASLKETVTKKKISLNDYKNQKNSGAVMAPAKHDQGVQDKPKLTKSEELPQAPKPQPVKRDKRESTLNSSKLHLHPPSEKFPNKRPSTSELDHLALSPTKGLGIHSPKKPRLSPEKDIRIEAATVKSNSPRLPVLLSPTLPPTSGPKLPRLLSPTLPPDIEKELARLEERSPTRESPKRETVISKPRGDRAIHARTPPSNSSSNPSFQSSRTGVPSKDANQTNLMVVKLRYGKANRRRVEGLLKFSGKRKLHQPDSPPSQETDFDDASNVEKKREETGSIRRNVPGDRGKEAKGSVSKTHTPAPFSSSTLPSTHDRDKALSLTPVKDSKGSAPRQVDLRDGDGKTPTNPANKRHSVDPGAKGSPSQHDNRSRNNERRVWRDEYQKFGSIGRDLKHAAERYTAKSGVSLTDEKLAAVTAIEAIMCFILAFVADDQSKVLARQIGDSSTWRSILAYWRVVKKNCASYPVLHSLCLLLGAVSFDSIHVLDLERFAASPLPGEHTPVPTPGSDGNSVLSDENKKSRKEFSDLKNRLLENYKESQKLWLEGTRGLSEDVLSREFPTTWSRRSHNHAERGKTSLKPGDYTGDYFLPLGATTSPIEVVRFGWSVLTEWCAQESVEWKGRLGL